MRDVAEDWARVSEAIRARVAKLSLTVAEIDRAGVSDKTFKRYIEGEPIRRADKRRQLCEILGWTPRSIDLLLDGGDPEVVVTTNFDQLLDDRLSSVEERLDRLEGLVTDRLRRRGDG